MAGRAFIDRISPISLGVGISLSLLALLVVSETVLGRWDALLAGEDFNPLAREPTGVLRDLRSGPPLSNRSLPARGIPSRGFPARDAQRQANRDQASGSARLHAGRMRNAGQLDQAEQARDACGGVDRFRNSAGWDAEVVWHRVLGPLTGVGQAWLAYAITAVSLRMSRIAQRLNRIDLLDLTPLAPFAQQGLTNALLLVGVLSVWSLTMLETGFIMIMMVIGSSTLVLAVLVLVAPVRGVHKRVREAKQQELAWIGSQIADLKTALSDARPDRKSGDLADMAAYRTLIENVPEWPFSGSTYVRLFIYALIPLASWGVGIVAEEAVGRLIF
jgi:hypothetical protein